MKWRLLFFWIAVCVFSGLLVGCFAAAPTVTIQTDEGTLDKGINTETSTKTDSVVETQPGTESETTWDSVTNGHSDDLDSDTKQETAWDTSTDTQCSGRPDFFACEVVTKPDRSYDICVSGQCVSPGCGDASCNPPGPHFPLADTNQRQCYSDSAQISCPPQGQDFFGQDAQHGWDVSHDASLRYERMTSEANQPIVRDNVTGLEWQGCLAGVWGSSCEKGKAKVIPWNDAVEYCDKLKWLGHEDWRLPDPHELSSIIDSGRHSPALEPTVFPGAPILELWSLSSRADDSNQVWRVDFERGSVNYDFKKSRNQIRCVRGGPFNGRRFIVTTLWGDRVVQDSLLGLMWQGCEVGSTGADCALGAPKEYDWKQALAYCEGLSHAGHADWRLPNRAEILSIVDFRRISPSVDATVFPAASVGWIWSSSSRPSNLSRSWHVRLEDGLVYSGDKGDDYRVRCVRGESR